MKVHVILLAGGTGTRFGTSIPKQFVKVDDVPIIIYTLKRLQLESITDITIVCISEWIEYVNSIVNQYSINKVINVIPGGKSAFESTRIGIDSLEIEDEENEMILIHDAVRPLLPAGVINDAVEKASLFGNACASLDSIEGLVLRNDELCGVEPADRYRVMRVQTPQVYKVSFINELLRMADEERKSDFPYADGLCIYYKKPLYFSKSFSANIKVTTKPDIAIMKAMLQFADEELLGEDI